MGMEGAGNVQIDLSHNDRDTHADFSDTHIHSKE
jgi:hypothetical protein